MKRLRFSLLSLVVGVLLLAAVMHLNLRPRLLHGEPHYLKLDVPETVSRSEICTYGWLLVACKECRITVTQRPPDPQQDWSGRRPCPWKDGEAVYEWYASGFAGNVVVGLVTILLGATACEIVLRRRVKKKSP